MSFFFLISQMPKSRNVVAVAVGSSLTHWLLLQSWINSLWILLCFTSFFIPLGIMYYV